MKITFRPGQHGGNKFKKPIEPPKQPFIDEKEAKPANEETPIQAAESEQPIVAEKQYENEQLEVAAEENSAQSEAALEESSEQIEAASEESSAQLEAVSEEVKGKWYDDNYYGSPEYPDYPDCPEYPDYPQYPDYPDDPACPEPDCPGLPDDDYDDDGNRCAPYPDPGFYYPLQCLGYPYIPWQKYLCTFTPRKALEKGTLFPELYSPYYPEETPPRVPRPYLNFGERRMPQGRRR